MQKQSCSNSRTPISGALLVCSAALIGACGGGASTEDSNPTNGAPTISGTPPTIVGVGQAYSFTPVASDPDGDTLTFNVDNRPSWATFDTANGSLTGTPSSNDSGPYPNVSISVSDGQFAASLPVFAIQVDTLAAGSARLTWTAPTLSADGSALNDLRGYRIRWGTQTGSYPNLQEVNNPNATSTIVRNLASASYFFVVTAVDITGNESVNSNEVTIVVP